jgi:hypothetical protein
MRNVGPLTRKGACDWAHLLARDIYNELGIAGDGGRLREAVGEAKAVLGVVALATIPSDRGGTGGRSAQGTLAGVEIELGVAGPRQRVVGLGLVDDRRPLAHADERETDTGGRLPAVLLVLEVVVEELDHLYGLVYCVLQMGHD